MIFESTKHTIAQHYLPALVNGDFTGMDEDDIALFKSWLEWATQPWKDTGDNLWVFAHEAVVDDSENEFAHCEVSDLHAATADVLLHFRPFTC